MAVADCIPVAGSSDGDRRDHRAALLGEPEGDPAPAGPRGGSKSPSNWRARWASTVPVIASSGISRTPPAPRPRNPRSRWTASCAHSAQRRRIRRHSDARCRARTALTNARSASAASHPISPPWSINLANRIAPPRYGLPAPRLRPSRPCGRDFLHSSRTPAETLHGGAWHGVGRCALGRPSSPGARERSIRLRAQLHPVSFLELGLQHHQPPRRPDKPASSGTTASDRRLPPQR